MSGEVQDAFNALHNALSTFEKIESLRNYAIGPVSEPAGAVSEKSLMGGRLTDLAELARQVTNRSQSAFKALTQIEEAMDDRSAQEYPMPESFELIGSQRRL